VHYNSQQHKWVKVLGTLVVTLKKPMVFKLEIWVFGFLWFFGFLGLSKESPK